MLESEIMSKNREPLSARNLILAAAGVLVLSVLGMLVSMFRPHDSGGRARDSFGTRGSGYRALVETLEELGVRVSRSLAPPQPEAGSRHTIVLLNPNARLVSIGPKYVHALRAWVEAGGRVVVSPSANVYGWDSNGDSDEGSRVEILEALGVDDYVSAGETSTGYDSGGADNDDAADSVESEIGDDDFSVQDMWSTWNQKAPPPRTRNVTLTGSLAPLAGNVRQLAVPGDTLTTLVAEPENLAGALLSRAGDGSADDGDLLIAVVRHGAGEIIVVSDPAILSNRLLALADNSVLAVNLVSPEGQDVVFDEFYHGLAVRGNPLYLLTRPGFAAVTTGLLLVVGALAWRSAVFLGPPLGDTQTKRRDIGEYVTAMGEFFSRGRDSRRFIVHELRDGVLRQICRELRLPIDTLDVEAITTALARRDPARAERLAATIRDVDTELALPGDYPRSNFLPVMKRLASCL